MLQTALTLSALSGNRRFVPRRRATVVTLALLVPMALASTSAALAQDGGSLADTVARLERQLKLLEENIYRTGNVPAGAAAGASGGASPAAVAQLNVRIGAVEEQLRQITGDVETFGFDLRRLTERIDKLATDMDFRLRSLEKGGAPAAAAGMPEPSTARTGVTPEPGTLGVLSESQLRAAGVDATKPTAAPVGDAVSANAPGAQTAAADAAVALPAGDPAAQYEYAFSYLMRRDFAGAEQAFRQFVDAHPDNELAGNAQYWLGETYYVRNDFEAAARTFAEGFQRYPESGKAADNLLKLGLSLAALDRKQDACITFAKLEASYPGAPTNILQRANRERSRLGCG